MSALLATATAAKSGSTVTAIVNGITTIVQVARDLTVAAGDVLLVERIGPQWFASARVFPAATVIPEDNEAAPEPKPVVTSGTLVVSPVETRSYRNGSWRTDNTLVYQGEYGSGNHTGAVFYGTKPRSLTGAIVSSATIQVKRTSGGAYAAQATTMRLVTQATRPSGAPTLGATAAGPSLAVGSSFSSFAIPTSWAQSMVDGTAGGIGFFDADGSPYVKFYGRGEWSPAFTLTINWRRG